MNATITTHKAVSGGGRPDRYVTSDGKRVPGTTTITGRFKDSGALIRWAWKQGSEGVPLDKAKDEAAESGHIAHALIEAHLLGVDPPAVEPGEIGDRAMTAYNNFVAWKTSSAVVVEHVELPIVSDAMRFGGTLDAVGHVNGSRALIDWKSSNGVYPEYIAQLGAYAILWNEKFPHDPITEAHLVRFAKDSDTCTHHRWGLSVLEQGMEAFRLQRAMYDLDALLRKAAK